MFVFILLKISPGSSSPRLSNDKIFPLFLRTVSSDAEIAVGITAAMKKFGWSRVALITQSENIFTFVSYKVLDDYTYAHKPAHIHAHTQHTHSLGMQCLIMSL